MKTTVVGFLLFCLAAFSGNLLSAQPDLVFVNSTNGETKELSLDDILSLDQAVVRTANEFVDGEREFTGPLMRDLLMACKAGAATHVRLIAANDYQIEVEVEEFFTYDVILAHSMDNERLPRRDKGPLWLIYPMSENAELNDPVFNSRLIWQVVRVEFW